MLHQLLKYLGVILIILAASQCLTKCKQKPPYDTVNLDLKWEEETHPVALSGLELADARGLHCYLPSRKATYFLNAEDGNCWEFIKEGDGLACNAIGNLPSFTLGNSFVFVAGSSEQESLFFGTIAGNNIDVYRLESGTWMQVVNAEDVSTSFFSGLPIDISKFVVSCTIEQEEEKKGCLILKLTTPVPIKEQLGCLLFSAEEPYFQVIDIDPAYHQTVQHMFLTGLVAVKNGIMILGKGHRMYNDRYDLLLLKDGKLTLIDNDIPNDFTVSDVKKDEKASRPTWEVFPLILEGEFPIAEPIFSIFHGKRSIYRMDAEAGYEMKEMTLPPDPEDKILNQRSLILPFYNELYWITTITTEDNNKKTVSYKGTLVTMVKKPEPKP